MIERLKFLGLSHYESKALELLMRDRLNLLNLSKKTKIPFGKIYSVVKSLKEKELIKETNSRPKLVYVENASRILSKMIDEKQNKEEKIIESLRQITTEIDEEKNQDTKFFQIGTSVCDNRQIQLRSFIEAQNEILQILNVHHKPNSNRESKTIWEKEIVKSIKKGIVFKTIYPKKIVLPKILQKLNKKSPESFQVKRFNTDFIRCDIIDGKKVLIKIVHSDPTQFGGVLFIENKGLASNLKKIFNEMWEQAV